MSGVLPKGEVLAAINDGLVALHTRYYGKGPTAAKTHYLEHDDAVICFMWEGFTKVEETLIDAGRGETVANLRRSFQAAMENEFTTVVEAATHRTVTAYLSQIHIGPNLAVEIFLLEPRSTGDPSAAGRLP